MIADGDREGDGHEEIRCFGDEICEPSQIVRPEDDYVLMILSRDEVAKRVDARQDGRGDHLRTEGLLPVSGLRSDIAEVSVRTYASSTSALGLRAGSFAGSTSSTQPPVFHAGTGVAHSGFGTNFERWTSFIWWM